MSVSSIILGILFAGSSALAQTNTVSPAQLEFFEKQVRPVLVQNCHSCHSDQARTVFGALKLDSRAGVERGGHSGPVVAPGDPDSSRLIHAIRYDSGLVGMPPTGKLPDRQIEALAEWVRMGAPWPEQKAAMVTAEARSAGRRKDHWAWQAVKKQEPPETGNSEWPRGAIDRFILAKLEENRLSPGKDADRYTMLRRVALDLTGLPPTPESIEAFAGDSSPSALESVVDRLLASPEFGERWGRHWLDLSGYADNLGIGRRIPSRHAWRYRDYVIGAFNSDKPYDQFVREQIAGDVLEFKDDLQRREQIVATGFLAIGPWALVDGDKTQLRMDVVDNQIDTLGRAVLGLTLGCARCHDHKFDPVPHSDYYALAGIFMSTKTLEARMSGVFSGVYRATLPETPEELIARAEALKRWQPDYDTAKAKHEQAAAERDRLKEKFEAAKKAGPDSDKTKELASKLGEASKKAGELKNEAGRLLYYQKPTPPMALALADRPVPENARINLAGNPHMLGEEVPRGFLSVAATEEPVKFANRRLLGISFQKSSGRFELAGWLSNPENPLTARVMVNRIWHHLFGAGIVRTVDNFGLQGELPSHPELLDYLASRFVELDWSVKKLIREIVLTRTYQLAANHNAEAAEADPENRLLWRANRRRLEAEALRDAVLLVSGALDRRRGGMTLPLDTPGSVRVVQPPFMDAKVELGESRRYRRTVYLPTLRKSQLNDLDLLNLFDFPDPNTVTGRRDVTTVPPQALYLMNSPFLKEQSELAAGALLEKRGVSDSERVAAFLLRALGRPAGTAEVERALAFLQETERELGRETAWARYCHAVFICNEFIFRS